MKINSHQYYDYFNVPVALCTYSLQVRKVNQVRLYLYFKAISNGYIKNNSKIYTESAKKLGVTKKTILNHRNWLIKEGWLIPDYEVNSFRIISFEILASKLNFFSATGVLLYKSEIKNYKSIAIAAVIEYHIMGLKRRKHAAELKMWSSQPQKFPPYPHLPNSYLAKVLQKSKTSAWRYIKLSQKKRYLQSFKKYEDLMLPSADINLFKTYGPYEPEKLKKIKGRIVKQLPNELKCNITLRRKDNLRRICQENREGKKTEPLNVDTFNQ